MDDVTDTVFRQIIAECAPPDLFMTEFVNVDGLQSPGRDKLLKKLLISKKDKPIIAQLWGKSPENYYKTAQQIVAMGFDGIDINMGCPEKSVIKNGCCIALINNRELAGDIIQAVKEGASSLPLSVKTRLGLNDVDFSWHEYLLNKKLNMLTIHGRTAKQMSKVPADWEAINHIRMLRDSISPATSIVGNGDVLTRDQGNILIKKYNLDGIMIGRGIFQDPYVFSDKSQWDNIAKNKRLDLYSRHVKLFLKTWTKNERPIRTLNKFCKVYINNFDGAKELREKLMNANSGDEILNLLKEA